MCVCELGARGELGAGCLPARHPFTCVCVPCSVYRIASATGSLWGKPSYIWCTRSTRVPGSSCCPPSVAAHRQAAALIISFSFAPPLVGARQPRMDSGQHLVWVRDCALVCAACAGTA